MNNKSPAKKAWKTRKHRKAAKKAIRKVKARNWEPEKVNFLTELNKHSKNPDICMVCGDSRKHVLQKHHADRGKKVIVTLCANCHDLVRRGTLEELKNANKKKRR